MSATLEAKMDGMREAFDQRFTGIEREQNGIIAWLERLSASVEKVADFAGSLLAVQTRQGHLEARMSDFALDIDAIDTRLSDIESEKKVSNWRTGLVIAGLSSAATALISYLALKVFD